MFKSNYVIVGILLPVWVVIYHFLENIVKYFVYDVFGMEHGQALSGAIEFFMYEVPKVLLLLTLIVFGVGIIRSYFSPEKTRKQLEGKPFVFWAIFSQAYLE